MASSSSSQPNSETGAGRLPETLVGLLRRRALHEAGRRAYTFLADGEAETHLTYGELEGLARAVAANLQREGAAGERVLLLYPPGLEYVAAFFGCLYAEAVAVPAYPPRLNRSLLRLQAVAADAEARFVLTNSALMTKVARLPAGSPRLESLRWMATDEVGPEAAEEWREPEVGGESLAFLQYTSGSTATPKGVMVSHANLMHNERMIQAAFRTTPESVVVGWLPLYHDMGLIGNVLHPLYVGAPCVLMSPLAFLQRPLLWLQAISRYRATTSGGPNFAYDLCVRKVGDEQKASLDLSSWGAAFNGAEPVRHSTLESFAASFAACGFRREAFLPCYGLAEATLMVSGGKRAAAPTVRRVQARALERRRVVAAGEDDAEARALVGCGEVLSGQEVVVVEPDSLRACAPGEVGEIWVAGANVARGYWKSPEETARTFGARPDGAAEGSYLRTGDLGFVADGELFVTGRVKDLIIIRGLNYYPHDIEQTVRESDDALRAHACAAFSVEAAGEERLVVVQEVNPRQRETGRLINLIRERVGAEHELPVHAVALVKPGGVPKTSSGKIQRHACRAAFLAGSLPAVAEWRDGATAGGESGRPAPAGDEDFESWLVAQVAARAGLDPAGVDTNKPLTHYGLDSLAAVELTHAVESSLNVSLPASFLLEGRSIAQLAAELQTHASSPPPDAPPARAAAQAEGEAAAYPLSHGQQSLWFMQQLTPESAALNLRIASRVRSRVDAAALRRAFQSLVDRHPALRTTFGVEREEPVQFVHERAEVCFEGRDASAWTEEALREELLEEAHRPFDLSRGPLMRVRLFTRGAEESVLLVVLHHIAADYWSLAILMRELGIFYRAETGGVPADLPPLERRYTDYVGRQARLLSGAEGERLGAYWHEALGGAPPALDLPTDRPRPARQTFSGATEPFALPEGLAERLGALGRAHDTTLFVTLLAAFNALLYRYAGQQVFTVGSPAAGRRWADFAGVVGYFANPLVLRADISGDPPFEAFLRQTRRTVLDAFAHQDYPFDLLVKRLQPEPDYSRPPLFQVMFILQRARALDEAGRPLFVLGGAGARMNLGGLVVEPFHLEQRAAQFDITMMLEESGGGLRGLLEYNTDLFDEATMRRLLAHFRALLEAVAADPSPRLTALPLLSAGERHQLLAQWNDTRSPYPERACIHELFAEQAARTPEALALVDATTRLSYRELNERANRLARHLRSLGVVPETRVGLCMERSAEMVTALLAILKAGGAYVPLDPKYPRERLGFMLEDAQIPLLLTTQGLAAALPEHDARVVCVDADEPAVARQDASDFEGGATADNLAYVIYTSGSTGKPKGVLVPHRGLCNLSEAQRAAFDVRAGENILQFASLNFDASIFEIVMALAKGATLHLGGADAPSGAALVALLRERGINNLTIPPSVLASAEAEELPSLRTVIVAGEACPAELVARWAPGRRFFNAYGPTEATVWATVAECQDCSRKPDIGRPIRNTRIYLLDAQLRPVPVGVAGELHIGGVGLARGYHNRPGLTAERFIPDPFGAEPGARLYKTGDLARYLPDGAIDYLGRADGQVKIRSLRIELGEIEAVLLQHPAVRAAAVAVRETDAAPGDKRLVAYFVSDAGVGAEVGELRRFLQQKLPGYMIPSAFVRLEALPLTPNGKLDTRALPALDHTRPQLGTDYVAPRDAVEETLANVWGEILGLERVGVRDNFFELGGHSLLATKVVSRVRAELGAELSLRAFFEAPTVADLAAHVRTARGDEPHAAPDLIPRRDRDEHPPLSFAQERMWVLQQLEPDSYAYNVPAAVRLSGALNVAALERTLTELVRRHETLRTNFTPAGGRPVQIISPTADIHLTLTHLEDLPADEREERVRQLATEESSRPFDLRRDSLLRVRLLRLGPEQHVLLLTMHHIVFDAWSMAVLVNEVAALYAAFDEGRPSPLPELPIQYADFASWQQQRLRGEVLAEQLGYWKRQLAGMPTTLSLPTDRPRPPKQTFNGAHIRLELPAPLADALGELSRREGVTLFMLLLAAFDALLYRYTGQEDIAVGTPVANRTRAEVEPLIGFFVNMLVMRARVSGEMSFRELLSQVRETALGAYAHQDLPFEKLVEELQPERDLSRTPIFQVVFGHEKETGVALHSSGLTWTLLDIERGVAKFDLTFTAEESGGGLRGLLEYNTDLFDEATMRRLLTHFRALLEAVAADPSLRLSEIRLLTGEETRGYTPSDFPGVELSRKDFENLFLELGEAGRTD